MPYTIAIVSSVLVYVWFVEGRLPRELVFVPGGLVIVLTIHHDWRRHEWGFSGRAFLPGLWRMLLITGVMSLAALGIGATIGTLHDRRDFLGNLLPLIVWGGAQQWVLQTVVLREAQRATSRRAGIIMAALLFGAIHLPNPFLAPVTAIGALVWCWLYDRYPNILPLALSHGLGTLVLRYAFDDAMIGRLRIGASYLRLGS